MKLFRSLGGRHDLTVLMSGVKAGNRFLQLGCGDGGLLAALAARTGLNGRACAIDSLPAAVERARRVALQAGVLVEVEVAAYDRLPYDDGAFDLVVLRLLLPTLSPEARTGCLQQVLRVLRPGGRCFSVEPGTPAGWRALFGRGSQEADYKAAGGPVSILETHGFRPARQLADRGGFLFVEGRRP